MRHTKKSIGEDLRMARMASGRTQLESAEYMGLSRGTIANLEAGRAETSASNYLNLMEFYNGRLPAPARDELVVTLRTLRTHLKATAGLLIAVADNPYLKTNGQDQP